MNCDFSRLHQNGAWCKKKLDVLNEKAILARSYFSNGQDSTIVEADLDAESYDQEYLSLLFMPTTTSNFKGYNAQS